MAVFPLCYNIWQRKRDFRSRGAGAVCEGSGTMAASFAVAGRRPADVPELESLGGGVWRAPGARIIDRSGGKRLPIGYDGWADAMGARRWLLLIMR